MEKLVALTGAAPGATLLLGAIVIASLIGLFAAPSVIERSLLRGHTRGNLSAEVECLANFFQVVRRQLHEQRSVLDRYFPAMFEREQTLSFFHTK